MRGIGKIRAVALREIRLWRQRPLYIIGSLFVIAFSTVFYLTLLGSGMPSKLPIGVVDEDGSSLTRNIIRQLDATQLGAVVRYDTFSEARADMQKGRITSVVVFPEDFYADVLNGVKPVVPFYLNELYFVGGSLAYKDILTMLNLAAGAVTRETLRARGVDEELIMGELRPVNIDTHQIGNVTTDYGVYLNNVLLPGTLQMVVILFLVYSLGTELKYGTSRHLLATARGSMQAALGGKLLVYTLYFTLLGFSLVLLLYRWLHYPMAGSVWNMLLAILLLVLSSEAVALLIIEAVPVCRFAISIAALYSILGFSMAGFTLPVELMPRGIRGLSEIFPLRHYYLFYVQEAFFGAGFAGWWKEVVHLLLFLLPPTLGVRRLEDAYVHQNYPKD